MTNLVRKISAKSICGKIEVPEKATALFTVIGIANGLKVGMSNYGEWTALTGQFEATNIETGEVSTAPQVFLPEPWSGMIAAKVRTPDSETKTNGVRFALEIGVEPSDVPRGYEFTGKELVKLDVADPLEALRDALPQPKKNGKKNGKK